MERLLNGEEKCPLIFIEDDLQCKHNSVTLLQEFSKNLCQRCDIVYFICFTKSCCQWRGIVSSDEEGQKPIFVDASNYLQWNSRSWTAATEFLTVNKASCIANDIISDALKRLTKEDIKIGVICDDSGPLISRHGLSSFCQLLSTMIYQPDGSQVKFSQVVMVTHGDCTTESISNCLFYQSKAFITLHGIDSNDNERGLLQCRLRLKRSSGKYSDEIISMKKIPSIGLRQIKLSGKPIKIQEEDTTKEVDPSANLSFNLSLTDSEKEARSKIRLPYTYTQDRQDAHLQRSQNEGKVFYQPDEADDYDEEDPDDDLNI